MTDLTDLIARVERLAEPSREIDAEIHCMFVLQGHRPARPDDFGGEYGRQLGNIKTRYGFLQSPRYTGSIDAITELIEDTMPGRPIAMVDHWIDDKTRATCVGERGKNIDMRAAVLTVGLTRPITLTLAFLKAKATEIDHGPEIA